jgi:hypothetical protein
MKRVRPRRETQQTWSPELCERFVKCFFDASPAL